MPGSTPEVFVDVVVTDSGPGPGVGAPQGDEFEQARVAAFRAGFDFVDLDVYDVDPTAAASFPEHRARRDHAVPIGWRYGLPVVAVATPEDNFILEDVYLTTGRDIHVVVATKGQIDHCIDIVYGHLKPGKRAKDKPAPAIPTSLPSLSASPAAGPASQRPSVRTYELYPPESTPGDGWLSELPGLLSEPRPADDLAAPGAVDAPGALEAPPAGSDAWAEAGTGATDLFAETPPLDLGAPRPGAEAAEAEPEHDLAGEGSYAAPGVGIADADLLVDLPALERVLVETFKVDEEKMAEALRRQEETGRPLREVVAELKLVSDVDLHRALAMVVGVDFVDLNNWAIDPGAATLLPESLARRYHILAIGHRDGKPVIATANPTDVFALDDVRTVLGREVTPVICTPQQIEEYLLRIYRKSDEADVAARTAAQSTRASEASQLAEINDIHAVVEDAPIVKFVNLILRQALDERASDVHLEPTADELQVRFRIDGVLHHVTSVAKAIQGGVTSRLKIMANLDIAEHRIPQDGRISLSAGRREIDLRVATLPTVHGENVVLRVLDKSTAPLDLERLGFMPDVLARYEASYRNPSGTVLVTGPTGSGKSTTLYATLNQLNSPERNLITVEDPVEYQLRGINQVQVNPRAGLTFANALRSILRADPDVILIGEIRDRETATIAVEAALTGHLVLSSLHTNDAASAPMRLVEMGVEPFLVCSALDCVLAQRLARVLCDNCAEEYEPTEEELKAAHWVAEVMPDDGPPRFRRPVGCQACSRTGYRGRIAVQEVLLVSEEVERAILARASTEEIKRLAVFEGMSTLERDGLRKAAMGLTSLEEILRVIV